VGTYRGPAQNSRDNLTTVVSTVMNRFVKVRGSGDTCEVCAEQTSDKERSSHDNLGFSIFCCSTGRYSLTVRYEGTGLIIQTSHSPLTCVTETLSYSVSCGRGTDSETSCLRKVIKFGGFLTELGVRLRDLIFSFSLGPRLTW
jgi:hypothetical protein